MNKSIYKKIYDFMKTKETNVSKDLGPESYKEKLIVTGTPDKFNLYIYFNNSLHYSRIEEEFKFNITFDSNGINMEYNDFIKCEIDDDVDFVYNNKYSNMSLQEFKNTILTLSENHYYSSFGRSQENDDFDGYLIELVNKIINTNEIITDFIYNLDDSSKLKIITEYDSINEYFNEPYNEDIKLNVLTICTINTNLPIIKLEKIDNINSSSKNNSNKYKFIVELTNNNGEDFIIRSILNSPEQLTQKLHQTIDALKQYPEFIQYADDLENFL